MKQCSLNYESVPICEGLSCRSDLARLYHSVLATYEMEYVVFQVVLYRAQWYSGSHGKPMSKALHILYHIFKLLVAHIEIATFLFRVQDECNFQMTKNSLPNLDLGWDAEVQSVQAFST